MRVEDLTLVMIDDQRHLVTSEEIVRAVAYASRLGWGDVTCYRFVTALVMTDNLDDNGQWPSILRKIAALKESGELAAMRLGYVITGEVE